MRNGNKEEGREVKRQKGENDRKKKEKRKGEEGEKES